MAQWLRVLAVLPEDPTGSDSQHPLGDSQLTGTLVSGDQTPLLASSGTKVVHRHPSRQSSTEDIKEEPQW